MLQEATPPLVVTHRLPGPPVVRTVLAVRAVPATATRARARRGGGPAPSTTPAPAPRHPPAETLTGGGPAGTRRGRDTRRRDPQCQAVAVVGPRPRRQPHNRRLTIR